MHTIVPSLFINVFTTCSMDALVVVLLDASQLTWLPHTHG